jgi:cytochrome c biogenesis protein ResB
VVDSGRELLKREILVDDSLNYGGVRFSQSSFASYDTVDRLVLTATPRASSGLARELGMAVDDAVALDPDWTVRLADISPTAAHADLKANDPAAHLVVTAKKTGKTLDLWLGQPGSTASIEPLPWQFQIKGLQVSHIMGLEASHEPGQWGVWAGVVLMAIGLSFAYFLAHERYWVVPIKDLRTGKVSLWIGGSANRTRIGFEARFRDVASEIEKEMKVVSAERATRYSLC